jgi:DNA polymerase-3 subunit gamma/tau
MEYQALYRKYRPQRFDEVVGQDHITRTLAREVVDSKVAHAYLFAGPRGTGKTTTARLLAKSLNCANRAADGEPCNECVSCVSVTAGNSLDVIELDAASHNKVEDVREIRANVGTVAAAGGARKVYILDEAHMLSRAAGNALLKTLEEPPDHVLFVLATTEPYKLLDTIRSRAQRFDFLPVPMEVLIDHLRDIASREKFTVADDGLAAVATHARGSVRDSMSLLEQVAALGEGTVEAATVSQALGLADRDAFSKLAVAIAGQDAPAALALVAELAARGGDLRRFVAEAMAFFRGVFLTQYTPNVEEIADEPSDVIDEWRRHARTLSATEVLRAVDQLSEALLHLRQGREERLVTELTFIRLTRPETAVDPEALAIRLERLEKRGLATPAAPVAVPATPGGPPEQAPAGKPVANEPVVKKQAKQEQPVPQSEPTSPSLTSPSSDHKVDLATYESAWPAIAARMRDLAGPSKHALLLEVRPRSVAGGTVTFELPAHLPFHLERLKADSALHELLAQTGAEFIGVRLAVEFQAEGGSAAPSQQPRAEQEPERAPEKDDMASDGDAGRTDPMSLVVDMLDGEVIDE